ncbi:unnamed protein product [Linum tenue]|uniref:Uncharacterized protein n=1 Tax=Linum tenue TaxID=586396 RepID=A0AAV0R079_9ROSI|nr:unnamed protein product [Linum tenue]
MGGRDSPPAQPHTPLARHLRHRRGRRHGLRPRGVQAPRRERPAQFPGALPQQGKTLCFFSAFPCSNSVGN